IIGRGLTLLWRRRHVAGLLRRRWRRLLLRAGRRRRRLRGHVLLELRDASVHLGAVGRVGHLLQIALVVLHRDALLAQLLVGQADVVGEDRRRAQRLGGLELANRGHVVAGVVGVLAGLEVLLGLRQRLVVDRPAGLRRGRRV